MTKPIKPPTITYDIDGEPLDDRDAVRFLDECTTALFGAMADALDDVEAAADFVHQMLIKRAAKYEIRRLRGRPRGSRTRKPAENRPQSSQPRRERRERAEARVFDEYITEQEK